MSRFLNLKTFFSRYAQPASDSPASHVSGPAATAAPSVDPDVGAAASVPATRHGSASPPPTISDITLRKRSWHSSIGDQPGHDAIRPAKVPRSRQSSADPAPTPSEPTLTSSLTTLSQTPTPISSAPNTTATGQGPGVLSPSTQDDESRPSFVRSSQDSEREEQILPAEPTDDDDDDDDSDSDYDGYRRRAMALLQQVNSTAAQDESDSSSDASDPPVRSIQDALKVPGKGSDRSPTHRTARQTRAQTGVKTAPDTYYPEWQYFREEASHKNLKFSLKKLVKQQKHDEKLTEQLALARQDAELQSTDDEEDVADVDLLSRVIQDEEGEDRTGKLAEALARSRARVGDVDWRFFDVVYIDSRPSQAVEDGRADTPVWAADPFERNQAFLSGFAVDWDRLRTASVAGRRLSRVRYPETDDGTLREAYNHHGHLLNGREPDAHEVRRTLASIGASKAALDLTAEVKPGPSVGAVWSAEQRDRILDFVRRINYNGETRDPRAQVTSLEYTIRMMLDSQVAMDAELLMELQDAVVVGTRKLEAAKPDQAGRKINWLLQIGLRLFDAVEHPSLQMRLVSALPSYHASLHALRRRLALAYFLKDRSIMHKSLDEPALMDSITLHLQDSPHFDTLTGNIDYEVLFAFIYLLDVGIDSGFARPRPDQPADDQATFNSRVDSLAQCIYRMEARIKDTGTAQVSMTEAKGAADRLKHRLEHGVRTRQAGSERVFGRPAGGLLLQHGGSKDIMTRFLQPRDAGDDTSE